MTIDPFVIQNASNEYNNDIATTKGYKLDSVHIVSLSEYINHSVCVNLGLGIDTDIIKNIDSSILEYIIPELLNDTLTMTIDITCEGVVFIIDNILTNNSLHDMFIDREVITNFILLVNTSLHNDLSRLGIDNINSIVNHVHPTEYYTITGINIDINFNDNMYIIISKYRY